MKLSVSNIAWPAKDDLLMYGCLSRSGFEGLEIAPTRLYPDDPYNHLESAKIFSRELRRDYNLTICSMQSLWYGRNERLFGSAEERKRLMCYTKKAIDFAHTLECENLVFGCPENRIMEGHDPDGIALDFFGELGRYALQRGTVLSIEPNPVLYGTNFINFTWQAFELAKVIQCDGFKVNIDFGTIVQNNEDLNCILDNMNLVNHIHISEPSLGCIEKRRLHHKFAEVLRGCHYDKFVSMEMKNQDNVELVQQGMQYVKGVFK